MLDPSDGAEERLIDALRERALERPSHSEPGYAFQQVLCTVATTQELLAAEGELGFALTGLLRKLYLRLGNGGFGPAHGLMGIAAGFRDDLGRDVVALYQRYRQSDPNDPRWRWPERLLPILHLGCAMYACVDCSSETGRVILFDPSGHGEDGGWEDEFLPLAPSLSAWLRDWLSGADPLGGARP